MSVIKTKDWKLIFNYFVYLDKKFNYIHFSDEKINLESNYNFATDEAYKFKLLFNKYIYYLEIIYNLLNNEELFGTTKFVSFEKGVVFYSAQANLKVSDLKEALKISDNFDSLDEKIKKLCIGITRYYGPLNDEELVDLNHDDPLWRHAWNKRLEAAEFLVERVAKIDSKDKLDSLLDNEERIRYYKYMYSAVLDGVVREGSF